MKKIFFLIILVLNTINLNAQKWVKFYSRETKTYTLYHYNEDGYYDALYEPKSKTLEIISYCPFTKQFDIKINALFYNEGELHNDVEQEIGINYNKKIKTENHKITWPKVGATSDVVSSSIFLKVNVTSLKKWYFISVNYHDDCWNEDVTTKISLVGFTKAYNGKAKNKRNYYIRNQY